MPQVSKYKVTAEVEKRIFDIFLKTIADLRTKNEVDRFLIDFLSPTERVMLAKRLSIAYLLAKKYDYRSIAEILKVSTTTIGNVADGVKYKSNYQRVVKKLLKDEKIGEFFETIFKKISGVIAMGGTKAGAWREINRELKRKEYQKPF